MDSPRLVATLGGLLAVVFWASSVAVTRTLAEALGVFAAPAVTSLLAGLMGLVPLALAPGRRHHLRELPRPYWLICGSVFLVYMLGYYAAVGLARSRAEVLDVGLINYLWPSLTLLLTIPLMGARARWTLAPGLLLAGAGVVLVVTGDSPFAPSRLVAAAVSNAPAYGAALVGAFFWALYSVVGRRLAGGSAGDAVPVFLLAAGVLLGLVALVRGESPSLAAVPWGQLLYAALVPTLAAYALWDRAMRGGDAVLVASASYATPVLSTLVSCWWLAMPLTRSLALACLLVAAGAVLCRVSVVERP